MQKLLMILVGTDQKMIKNFKCVTLSGRVKVTCLLDISLKLNQEYFYSSAEV